MKKYFENPNINLAEIDTTDILMVSGDLAKTNSSTLLSIADDAEPYSNIWKGAGEGWL